MKTKTFVGRISEYGNDSLSLVIFPPHFEVSARFEDDRYESEDFDRPAEKLFFMVDFNNPELHDTEDETILNLKFYLPDSIPVGLYGEFIIELAGIDIVEFMQERITSDIADYLTDQSADKDSFLDLDELYDEWSDLVSHLVLRTVEKIKEERKKS